MDAEFRALTAIIQALMSLSPAARERILRYAMDYSRDELGDGLTTPTNGAATQPTAPTPQPAAQPAAAPAAPQQPPAAAGPDNPFAGM